LKEIRIESPAKVNLFLEVLGKRENGYHNVETVLETVDLCDDIILKEIKEGIEIESDFPSLPLGRENLAYQAAFLLKKRLGLKKGIQLTINKRIPLASGLGGGSSNGASVLLGLNKLWDLDLSYEELLGLAREIGADVPFFLRKGRALGRGRGDELWPLPQSPTLHFILIFPGFEISAEWAYKNLRACPPKLDLSAEASPQAGERRRDLTKERQSIKMILSALKSGDMGKVANSIYNRLEEVVIPKHPLIARIKERFLELGARGTLMSGSGSSVFGLAEDGKRAKEIYDKIKKDFRKIFLLKSFRSF
jgi:4-diphosphocytidyl-2-C-methyl-D-erythritol kinase